MPCTTILVGKKASNDGSTMIARNDDSGADAGYILAASVHVCSSAHDEVIAPMRFL